MCTCTLTGIMTGERKTYMGSQCHALDGVCKGRGGDGHKGFMGIYLKQERNEIASRIVQMMKNEVEVGCGDQSKCPAAGDLQSQESQSSFSSWFGNSRPHGSRSWSWEILCKASDYQWWCYMIQVVWNFFNIHFSGFGSNMSRLTVAESGINQVLNYCTKLSTLFKIQ